MRGVGALGAVLITTSAGVIADATTAGAATAAINNPRLTVVCSSPHNGLSYSVVRFRQHGRWTPNTPVEVTLGKAEHVKVTMHTRTGPEGRWHLRRLLHSSNTGPWILGTAYTWTTSIVGKGSDAAIARRGTVTLTNNC